jgi:hypothetical protein
MIAEKGRNIMNTKIFRALTEDQKYAIKDYVKNGGFEALKNYRNGKQHHANC